MSGVQLRALRKKYGTHPVVHGVDLDIRDGEFVVLVGPSGCGKSTILRMIAGLEDISGGEILINGQVVNDMDPKARNIAMVFQNYALYPHMSVRENINLNLRLSGMSKDEISRRVAEAARMLDIEALLDRRPGQLSGGQRQRVAMGRAMVREPSVFLFDEPLSNLDAKLRVQMRTEIKQFHQAMRRTSVYVTHDQIEAMTLADRVAVLRDGRIEQVGDPISLYRQPQNLFVAGFIGTPEMNIIDGTCTAIDGDNATIELDGGWPAVTVPATEGRSGMALSVGIRPEHLSVSSDGSGTPAKIVQSEITGAQTELIVEVSGKIIRVVVNRIATYKLGEMVQVSFNPLSIHLFDRDSTQRVNGAAHS
jgi:multiple sugar transport system ATP-binding protein